MQKQGFNNSASECPPNPAFDRAHGPFHARCGKATSPRWAASRLNSATAQGMWCCQAIPRRPAEIDREDDAMDDLHRHLFTVLMNREWKHAIASAVDVTLLG